jgi:virulence-associated protein VapD
MFDLIITCLADHVYSIRDAACQTIQRVVDIFGLEWARQTVLPKVFQLADEQNYLRRMTMLFQINYLMSAKLKEKVNNTYSPITQTFLFSKKIVFEKANHVGAQPQEDNFLDHNFCQYQNLFGCPSLLTGFY